MNCVRLKASCDRPLMSTTRLLVNLPEHSKRWSSSASIQPTFRHCVYHATRRCIARRGRTRRNPTSSASVTASSDGRQSWSDVWPPSRRKQRMKINLKNMIECLQVWILFLIFATSKHICGWNKPLQQAAFFMPSKQKKQPIPHRVEIRKRLQGISIIDPDSS